MTMSMRTRGMAPSDVVLPITPMLDMSFQLLFFFICIYKPPTSQEAQFLLNLKPPPSRTPPPIQGSGTGGSASPSSKESEDPFKDAPIGYNITLDVYTHINPDSRGVGDFLVEKITIKDLIPGAKKRLIDAGVVKESSPTTVEVLPAGGGSAPDRVSADSEKALLDQVPKVLKEAKSFIPPDSAPPLVKIAAPREIRTHKIVKLMDYCHAAGFGLDLQVAPR
jgi:biopolymer transport protein ExbD